MKRVVECFLAMFSFVVPAFPVELSEALETDGLVWESGGDALWFGQTNVMFDAEDAAQSGSILDSQQVWMQTSVTGPGLLGFTWKVSSEPGYDYLRCTVEGDEARAKGISGESDWTYASVNIGEGTHTVRWTYSKDSSASSGSDCGWVDQIEWIPGFPCLTTEPSDTAVPNNGNALLTVRAAGEAPFQYQWYEGESGDVSTPIIDATNSVLEISSLTSDARYWVQVWNDRGDVYSRTAQVRIGFEVYTLEDLQKIGSGVDGWTLDSAYVLMNDIDASATAFWNDDYTDETVLEGFSPIGKRWYYDPVLYEWVEGLPFTGLFDGKGHVIRGLVVRRRDFDSVGLFGYVEMGATIQNVGMVSGEVVGDNDVGGLTGENFGRISSCFAATSASGSWRVGGLVGSNAGSIEQSYASCTVTGEGPVGGLAGINEGIITDSYAASSFQDGTEDAGGLVWESRGMEVNSYWDMDIVRTSAGGVGRTSDQMRQQATFAGWDFDALWGIQEEVGTPYLKQFAEGRSEHVTVVPQTMCPANMSFLLTLRPAMTAAVNSATCDFVNAHWQVATSSDFSNARDWVGADTRDGVLLGSHVPVSLSLEYGTLYYWRVRCQSEYGMWTDWSAPAMILTYKLNTVTAAKEELSIFVEGAFARYWMPQYLFAATADFSASIASSGTDYEARIYRALTTVIGLCENQALRNVAGDFGYFFDDALFTVTGAWVGVSSPLPNDTVDRIAAEVMPVIDSALADLSAIPANWTGTVRVSPDQFPVDQESYVDIGDVYYAKAGLLGAKAAVQSAQAYDLTIDYSKTNIFLPSPAAQPLAVTLDGNESEWTNTPAILFGDKAQLEYAKIARSDTQVFVLVRLADDVRPRNLWFQLEDDFDSGFYFEGLQEGVPIANGSSSAVAYYSGHVIEVVCDLPLAAQAGDIFLNEAGVDLMRADTVPAPVQVVTIDGDAAEWAAVPEAPLSGQRGPFGSVKIARDTQNIYVLATLLSGSFDNLSYFGFDVYNLLGNYLCSFSSYSSQVTLMTQGGILELSFPIPSWCQEETLLLGHVYLELSPPEGGFFGYDLWYETIGDEDFREETLQSANQFLSDHPACLSTVRNPDKLPLAKASLQAAMEFASAADEAIMARSDGLMHFFEYNPAQSNEQAEVRQRLHEAQASLEAPTPVTYSNRTETVYLGAAFSAPYLLRSLLPRLTDDNEVVVGTFPDPTFNGTLPNRTQNSWQDDLLGILPLAKENAFTMDGQTFTTGGYAFWEVAAGSGSHTNVAQSGMITNACPTWVETTLTGPGTLGFSWAVSSQERVDILSVYVDGIRQVGSLSGESGWGPRQLVLPAGRHCVRWTYVKNQDDGTGADGGLLDSLSWTSSAQTSTDTPVRVPYTWLDGFPGLVEGGDYNAAAWSDQDGDGKKTWEEFVMGTIPTNKESVLLATISKGASSLVIGWTPDLSPLRVYTVKGKTNLSDVEWAPTNSASRFFRVTVEMP